MKSDKQFVPSVATCNSGCRSGATTTLLGSDGISKDRSWSLVRELQSALCILPVMIGACSASPDIPSEEPNIVMAKTAISKDMLDPLSAQFRELNSSNNCVSGEVNSKNAFGAYTGFKRFYYSPRTKAVFLEGQLLSPSKQAILNDMKADLDLMNVSNRCNVGNF